MELELKYKLLGESDYNKLRDYLDNKTSGIILNQKNFYYDTEDMLLIKNNAILRARIENEKVIITFKQQKEKKQGFFISDEIENNVSLEDINRVFSGKIPIMQLCGDNRRNVEKLSENKELTLIGTFENKRIVYYIDDIKLELDKVDYGNGIVDYEIETESEDEKKVRK
ncbi:CYTH domain-containing protein, partial [bacterium]|nr:CYTH domain-containing protein [bacterium]